MGGIGHVIASRATALYGMSLEGPGSPEEAAEAEEDVQKPAEQSVPLKDLERLMHAAAARVGTLVSAAEIDAVKAHLGKKWKEVKTALAEAATAAGKAVAAMNAVRNLTGRKIVDAFRKEDGVERSEEDRQNEERIMGLFNCLGEVSGRLKHLYNHLPDDIPEFVRQAIEDLFTKNEMRCSELGSFISQARTIASETSEEGLEDDVKDLRAKMMGGTFGNLTKGMAAGMHGNLEAITKTFGEKSEAKRALSELAAAKNGLKDKDADSVRKVANGLKELSKSVDGIDWKEVDKGLYGGFMSAFAKHVNEVGTRLDATSGAIEHVVDEIIDNSPLLRIVDNPGWVERIADITAVTGQKMSRTTPDLVLLLNVFKMPLKALRMYADGKIGAGTFEMLFGEFESQVQSVKRLINMKRVIDDLKKCVASYGESVEFCEACTELVCACQQLADRETTLLGVMKAYPDVFGVGLCRINDIREKSTTGKPFSKEDVLAVLSGDFSVSDTVEMRLNGGPGQLPDPELCDDNLVGEEKIGSGASSTVRKLSYVRKDGSVREVAFKSDQEGTQGLWLIKAGGTDVYELRERSTSFNIATRYLAETFGIGNLVPGIQPLIHKGRYGIAMDVAKGTSVRKFRTNQVTDGRSIKKIHDLYKSKVETERRRGERIVGDLLHGFTDLSWFDLLCGQSDRHCSNFFVHVDNDTDETTITAIDNDMAFSGYRTGLTKIKLTGKSAAQARLVAQGLVLDELTPGVEINDSYVEIDAMEAPEDLVEWLRRHKGLNSFGRLPAVMSETMYMKLNALDGSKLSDIRNELSRHMSSKGVAATMARLEELKKLARKYKKDGKVVANGDWTKPKTLKFIKDNMNEDMNCEDYSSDYCSRDLKDLLS